MKLKRQRAGKIIPHGVKPESHELDTILFFTEMGKDVELIVPSNTPHSKRPDFYMDGLEWEMKSPVVADRRTVERVFYHASHQSANVILDLRRLRGIDEKVVIILEKCFKHTRHVHRMYVITKNGALKFYRK